MKNFLKNSIYLCLGFFLINQFIICDYAKSAPYDIANASYDSNSFDISNEENIPLGLTFNNDGTKMYVSGLNGILTEYDLGTAYDISTATFNGSTNTLGGVYSNPEITFNSNGSRLYAIGQINCIITEYSVATNFEIAGGVIATGNTLDVCPIDAIGRNLVFGKDGKRLYVLGRLNSKVYQFDLTTSYDLTSATQTGDFAPGINAVSPQEVRFNSDGSKMYLLTEDALSVEEFDLSTPWELSAVSYNSVTYDASSELGASAQAFDFNSNGTKMFMVSSAATVFQYSTGSVESGGSGGGDSGESSSNPTNDKDVVGSIESQVSNANNSFRQSVGMISNRLSYLRANRNENNLSNQNLKIDFGNTMLASITNALVTSISENKSKSILPNNWSSWTEGSISISKIGDTTNSSRKEIDTKSIAFGFDKKLNEGEVFGYAFQYGQSDTDVGSNGSGIDSKNYNLSLYKSKSLNNDNFVEGSIGIGKIKNDIDRKSGSNTLTGSRDGNQLFGSLNFGKTINKGDFDLTPTLGIDLGYTELDEYQEVGTNALFYDDQHIQSGMASLGLTFNNIVKFDNSSLKPFGSIEYGLDVSDSSDTRINYVSDTSTKYTYKHDVNSEHFIKSEIGFNYETKDNLFISSSYQRIQGEKHEHTDTLSFGLNFKSKRETEYAMQFGGTEDLSAGLNIAKNINGLDFNFKLDQEFNENRDKNAEISMIKKF